MVQRLLLFVSIILLFSFNASAEVAVSLPKLQINSSLNPIDSNVSEDTSLWKKTLDFLGFGDKKNENKESIEKEVYKETQIPDASSEIIKNVENNIPKIDDATSTVEDLEDTVINKDTKKHIDDINVGLNSQFDKNNSKEYESLSIPEGFGDDETLQLPEGMNPKNETITQDIKEKTPAVVENVHSSKEKILKLNEEDSASDFVLTDEIPVDSQVVSTISNTETPVLLKDQPKDNKNDLKIPNGFDNIKPEDLKLPDISEIQDAEEILQKTKRITENEKTQIVDPTVSSPTVTEAKTNALSDESPILDSVDNELTSKNNPVIIKNTSTEVKKNITKDLKSNTSDQTKKAGETIVPLLKSSELKTDVSSDISLPTPSYASVSNESYKQESNISKFTRSIVNNKSGPTELPKITHKDYAKKDDGSIIKKQPLKPIQLQFINNEAQVLILPNDDIVLGQLTSEAKINEMDFRLYIRKFWENYNFLKREPKREMINKFIKKYDK